jgi:hypothetical protein
MRAVGWALGGRRFCTASVDATTAPICSTSTPLPRFEDISTANYRIRAHGSGKNGMNAVERTACFQSDFLSRLLDMDIWVKCEFRHRTGSFKERGARNALMRLSPEAKQKGVIAASAGNHALGLSYHGQNLVTQQRRSAEAGCRVAHTEAFVHRVSPSP